MKANTRRPMEVTGQDAESTMLKKIVIGVLLFVSLAGLYWFLSQNGTLTVILDGRALGERIAQLGVWGPIAIVLLLASAIVWSPIPSAPIALAAGAVYGQFWGTVYVLIGAELGAISAFAIARLLGHEAMKKRLGEHLSLGRFGSQNSLMAIVFVTRLLPFISFDAVSYAAGLTSLDTWRFAIATLAGIAPASFALAYFGGEMASGNTQRIVTTVTLLFGFTFAPALVKLIWDRRRKETHISR
jgi:uncharacterized membrane protein YdjX (TVP38/TMEM64 family)